MTEAQDAYEIDDDETESVLQGEEFVAGLEALNHIVFGRNPQTGRSMAVPRKRDRAEFVAEVVADEVIGPIREALDTLNDTITSALGELDSAESTVYTLREAENGDEREDAYGELDEQLNAVRNLLSEVGVDIADTWNPKGTRKKAKDVE
jgi:hypothetical protein